MKKIFASIVISILLVLTFALSACGADKNGTYYPDKSEMSHNLLTKGYKTFSTSILVGDGTGTFLSATKDEDYIKFYWLDSAGDCDYYYNLLGEDYPDCDVLVKIADDEKFGNIVYCGTENAVNAAGIRVVEVKV